MADIEQYAPKSGRVLTESSTVVNVADLLNGTDVTFHDAETVADNGTEVTVGGYKNLTIEIYGTSTSRTVTFYEKGISGELIPKMGVNLADFSTGNSTTGNNEKWQFDITGWNAIVMDLTAVTGGDVSVAGRVVA